MTGEARHSNTSEGPLDGITVIDASRVLAGPFCTMQLGDLGAEVIKIERPETGDQTRGWYPPTYGDSTESAYYLSINRNKRSMTLNLATERGREIVRELARTADVLVENFRVGKMEEWGLGYQSLHELNPDLVYCSMSGYGEWGPNANRPAYDLVIQAESGMMSITGEEDGSPIRVGVAIADIGAGMYATQAILAALLRRELGDGTGEKLDISLLDGQVAWMTYMASSYFATGQPPGRMGSKHPTIAPYQAVPMSDGYVVIAVASQNLWSVFCEAIGREDLREDARFRTNADRVENRAELDQILEDEFAEYTTSELVTQLTEYGVPATNVKDLADVFSDDQVEARNMRAEVTHPDIGTVEMPGIPMHFSRSSTQIRRHPPRLGEHTDEILREIGFNGEDIDDFRSSDIV
jgi:crotonobetainyl-CoA:carnitine CoA-transferase CaiB-like acyl-CoA transferase